MKTIKANYVDIIGKQIFPAIISYSKTIVNIERVGESVDNSLPYCMPGFIDSHVHIESSMLNPQNFARMIVSFGTIAAVCDPHEIANVLGRDGVEYMMNDARKSPLKLFFALPSCVPSTPFETNGAQFDYKEIDSLMHRSVALAELMNYPGLVGGDPIVLKRVAMAKKHHRPIDGHIPAISGDVLRKYIAHGVSTDHECFTLDEAKEKISLGMKIIIRDGSAARNLDALFPLFFSNIDEIMVCTDDAHPDDILMRGHINKFYDYALAHGVSIFDVYRPLLLNPINHYKLRVGRLQVGDRADFIISDTLEKINLRSVIIEGQTVFDNGEATFKCSHASRPNKFVSSTFTPSDFMVHTPTDNPTLRVIEAIDTQLVTNEFRWSPILSKGSEVVSSDENDIVKIAIINRYSYSNTPVVNGFIRGTGLKRGAIASSVAHDSHNVVIIGHDSMSMSRVANEIFRLHGGIVATLPDGTLRSIKLPIGGLMVSKDWRLLAKQYIRMVDIAHSQCGTTLTSPFMTMAFMSLFVIPKIKIGDRGLFDVEKFQFTDLFVG